MKTLHILRKRKDTFAEAAICSEAALGRKGRDVTVLLIQDAVLGSPAVPVPVYANKQDLEARGVQRDYMSSEDQASPVRARGVGDTRLPAGRSEDQPLVSSHGPPHIIDYEQICQMIIDHDRTVVW